MLDLSEFFSIQASLLGQVSRARSRFLRENVDWNSRLLGIIGARGTGKTTLLLQHLAEQDQRHQRHLYVSADHIRLQASGLYEIASYFFRLGGETIMIDETPSQPQRYFFQEVPLLLCKKEKQTFPGGLSFTPFRGFPFVNIYPLPMDWNFRRFPCRNSCKTIR